MASTTDYLPSLPGFYRGAKILITGGSGFMGKVLVEKLLRSCPELDTIYLLLRPKKGKAPAGRLQDITKDMLFDTLRMTNPRVFDKLTAIAGDVTEVGLGLSERDRDTLQTEVEFVFHSAASVRFDDPLLDAVLINVRGPREMLELALGMRRLRAFVHVSTAFSNVDKDHLHECVHPTSGNWRTMLALAGDVRNDHALRCIKSKVLGKMPNTYTYTKALGEQVINDYRDRLPLVIVRPSIVLPPKFQGTIGWQDNINGPVAFWMAGYAGLIRVILLDPNIRLDYVPVDQAINSFLLIACQRALTPHSPEDALPVYNCCKMIAAQDERETFRRGNEYYRTSPTLKSIRWPKITPVLNAWCFWSQIILLHLLPYFLMDVCAELAGQKPTLVKFLRRTYVANVSMRFFTTKHTNFTNEKLCQLDARLAPEDREDFWFAKESELDQEFASKCLGFLRVHFLHDPMETMPAARIRIRRLYWIEQAIRALVILAIVWAVGTSSSTQWLLATGARWQHRLLAI